MTIEEHEAEIAANKVPCPHGWNNFWIPSPAFTALMTPWNSGFWSCFRSRYASWFSWEWGQCGGFVHSWLLVSFFVCATGPPHKCQWPEHVCLQEVTRKDDIRNHSQKRKVPWLGLWWGLKRWMCLGQLQWVYPPTPLINNNSPTITKSAGSFTLVLFYTKNNQGYQFHVRSSCWLE